MADCDNGGASEGVSSPGVVPLNVQEFYSFFPSLQPATSPEQVKVNFRRAERFLDNSPSSIITNLCDRQEALYDLTAFYIVLARGAVTVSQGVDGAASTLQPGLVGSVTNAHEGSVGVGVQSLQSGNASSTEKFLMQNQFGAMAWQIIQRYLHGPRYLTVGPAWDDYAWP